MQTERVKNSFYNGISNIFIKISSAVLSFIVRTFFIKTLGEECLGLDGLFTNILSLLSLAELGFSTAISFSLYSPLAKNDTTKVSELINFIKIIYRKIALFIVIAGLLLLPFLNIIVKDYSGVDNLYLIYVLYLINTAASYLVSYPAILIEADQKNYKLTKIVFLFDLITYSAQLVSIICFKTLFYILLYNFSQGLCKELLQVYMLKEDIKVLILNKQIS